jgi:hypothetical protein
MHNIGLLYFYKNDLEKLKNNKDLIEISEVDTKKVKKTTTVKDTDNNSNNFEMKDMNWNKFSENKGNLFDIINIY